MKNMPFYALTYDRDFKKLIVDENNERLKVHSIFQSVINLIDTDGQTYSILHDNFDNGPFAMRLQMDKECNFHFLNIKINDTVKIENNLLKIKDKIIISFENAILWSPEKLKIEANNDNKKVFNMNLELYEKYLLQFGVSGGCKYFYIENLITRKIDYKASLIERELKKAIDKFLMNINHSSKTTEDNIFKIIGLGSGLTPSGDDFLLGFIIALNTIQNKKSEILFGKIKCILHKKNLSTTTISKNMLRSGIQGNAREKVLTFVKQLFEHNRVNFLNSVEEIFSIGFSSGEDVSIGIILGIMYGLDILKI